MASGFIHGGFWGATWKCNYHIAIKVVTLMKCVCLLETCHHRDDSANANFFSYHTGPGVNKRILTCSKLYLFVFKTCCRPPCKGSLSWQVVFLVVMGRNCWSSDSTKFGICRTFEKNSAYACACASTRTDHTIGLYWVSNTYYYYSYRDLEAIADFYYGGWLHYGHNDHDRQRTMVRHIRKSDTKQGAIHSNSTNSGSWTDVIVRVFVAPRFICCQQ